MIEIYVQDVINSDGITPELFQLTANGTANGTEYLRTNGTEYLTANGTEYLTANGTEYLTANGTEYLTANGTEYITANGTEYLTPNGTEYLTANGTENWTLNVTANGTDENNIIFELPTHEQTYNGTQQTELFWWFINASEIAPGASAIIGNNTMAFYLIHHLALCVITVSLGASIVVVRKIHQKWKENASKLDFPIRFPLYLAIADTLWGLSHFTDHMYLVTVQTYPEHNIKLALSMNLWFFFGYQQLMHASVSGYTYLRVVHSNKLDLGKWEWKLHTLWFGFLACSIVLFWYVDSFGNTGYWMAHDATTLNGQLLGVVISLTSTFNALVTTLGYRSIRKTVVNIKSNLRTYVANSTNGLKGRAARKAKKAAKKENVASQCLTTYVYVASCLYCPLAVLLWINVTLQIVMGVVEPLSCLLIVIVANCSGWANAYGYFHNERLKKRKEKASSNYSSSAGRSGDRSFDSNSSSSEV